MNPSRAAAVSRESSAAPGLELPDDDGRLESLVALFVSAMGGVALAGAAFTHEPGHRLLLGKCFLLASLQLLAPARLSQVWRLLGGRLGSFAAWTLLTWAALAALGWSPALRGSALPPWAFWAVAAFWAWCAAGCARRALARLRTWNGWALGAVFAALLLYASSSFWGTGQYSLDISDQIRTATIHLDSLYYSTTAILIRDYGVMSAGIDGIGPIRIHFLAQSVLAAMSKLTGGSILEMGALYFSPFAPLFYLFGMAAFALALRREEDSGPLSLLLLASLAAGLLPEPLLRRTGSWDVMGSESFTLALPVFFAGILLFDFHGQRPLTARESCAAASWVVLGSFCKISIGFVAAVSCAFWALRTEGRRGWLKAAAFLGTFAACYPLIRGPAEYGLVHFQWLYFPNTFNDAKMRYFLMIHWLPVYIGAGTLLLSAALGRAWRVLREGELRVGGPDLRRLGAVLGQELARVGWAALREAAEIVCRNGWPLFKGAARRILEFFRRDAYAGSVLLPACLIGYASFSLTIRAGSGVFFSIIPAAAAIPWASAILRQPGRTALVVAALAASLMFQWFPRAFAAHERIVLGLHADPYPPDERWEMQRLFAARSGLQASPRCGLRVGEDWLVRSAIARNERCWKVPYIFTTVLERPLYGSLMPLECRLQEYSTLMFHPKHPAPAAAQLEPEALCRRAVDDGLSCVEELRAEGVRRSSCGARGAR